MKPGPWSQIGGMFYGFLGWALLMGAVPFKDVPMAIAGAAFYLGYVLRDVTGWFEK